MTESTWQGCYDGGWKGLIAEEAFAHPAKFSRALIARIYRHLLERAFIAPGSLVVDPFGGVALGALDAMMSGLHWIGCELEPRFHALGNQNIALWQARFGHSAGWGSARLVQGDSRRLCEVLGATAPTAHDPENWSGADAVIGSPPFSGTEQPCASQTRTIKEGGYAAIKAPTKRDAAMTGDTPGQLGALPTGSVDAVCSSPPFCDNLQSGSQDSKTSLARGDGTGRQGHGGKAGPSVGQYYGQTPGQLGAMPPGNVEAVVSSPPYADQATNGQRENRAANLEAAGIDSKAWLGERRCTQGRSEGYGATPANLGNLPAGSVADAMVSSPPYNLPMSQDHNGSKGGKRGTEPSEQGAFVKYGNAPGQLEGLPMGDVADGCVSSPPFEGSIGNAANAPETKMVRPNLPSPAAVASYLRERRLERGFTAKQIDDLLGTATLYSWYEGRPAGTQIPTPDHWRKLKSVLNLDDRFDAGILTVIETDATGRLTTGKTGHAKMTDYGTTEGQLGAEFGETFWSASRLIIQQCHAILKPGGVAAWVLKDFVRNKVRVPFSDDWRRLCEACGFVTVEWIKASLVKEWEEATLFEGRKTKRRERKSFFRRLAESKGSPRIDHEDVLIMAKGAA